MFAAEVAGMSAIVAFPALLPGFRSEWLLSNAEAGWISGIYFAGYVAATPVLSTLTDRIAPRLVFLAAMAVSALASIGFALFADGAWSASLWRFLQGIGFAGTYMPGLKALTDAVPKRAQGRAVALYTAGFAFGTGVSFFATGALADAFGWRWAFALLAIGPCLGAAIAAALLPRRGTRPAGEERPLLALAAIVNRGSFAFSIAYFVHNFESSTMRAWTVALLVFTQAAQASLDTVWNPTAVAALASILGLPSIVATGELAERLGRRATIIGVMAASALTGIALGAASTADPTFVVALMLVYGFVVTADSGAINAGFVARTDPRHRGAALALHSLLGFTGAFLGPLVFGIALDLAGGDGARLAWVAAFAVMAAIIALGPLALLALDRAPERR